METALNTITNWEKLGLVGLLLVAIVVMGVVLWRLGKYQITRYEEAIKSMREEIARREQMIVEHQREIVKLVEAVTKVAQESAGVIARNTQAMEAMVRVAERCPGKAG